MSSPFTFLKTEVEKLNIVDKAFPVIVTSLTGSALAMAEDMKDREMAERISSYSTAILGAWILAKAQSTVAESVGLLMIGGGFTLPKAVNAVVGGIPDDVDWWGIALSLSPAAGASYHILKWLRT